MINATYQNKVIMIVGGTGSFGNAMTNYLLAKDDVREIRVFSRDEAKQNDMRIHYQNNPKLRFCLGDVRDYESILGSMGTVDYVFHAAALKQVPSCEFFPMQAVLTNILGSENVIRASVASSVKSVVCLSTDKAVLPVNAMGMTKALMEKTAQATARNLLETETVVSCVRYGNVMCSRGSVIPLFIKQIKEGSSLTITERTMTRFMLALSDAVDLVEFAFQNATQGDLFIKKAPACTVAQLASVLLDIFQAKNEIQVIGMRHGEKLYETLATAEELRRSEDMGGYYRVKADNRDLNYAKFFTEGDPEEVSTEDYHSHNTEQLSDVQLRQLLLTLPEVQRELSAWQVLQG